MDVTLRILRFEPETDRAPHWETYTVAVDPMDRVLDLLIKVKAEQDGSLSFRRSCGHGICGSDAMLINNRNRLACRIRVDQLGKKISVAPLPGLPVIKDLIVDMSGFFGKYRSVLPYLINDQPEPERERRQSPADRAVFIDVMKHLMARPDHGPGRRGYCIAVMGCLSLAVAFTTHDIIQWASGGEMLIPSGSTDLGGLVRRMTPSW